MSDTDVEPTGVAVPRRTGGGPADGFRPTVVHLVLLLAAATAAPLGSVLIAPVLPRMVQHFAAVPGAQVLVPLVLTAPFLGVFLLAPFAGMIVDRVNRKRLLVVSMIGYGVIGTMPLHLDSLTGILISRLVLGPFEAMIITCGTALLSVMWTGAQRTRYLGVQVLVSALAATAFFAVGGALGAQNWRVPFLMYGLMIPIGLAAAALLREPPRADTTPGRRPAPIPRRAVLAPIGITVLANVWFYLLIVQLPFVLTDRGIDDPGIIGAVAAAMSITTAAGALTVGRVADRGPGVLLSVEFGLTAVGLLVVGLAPSVPLVVLGALVTGYGTGMLLPTLLSWTMNRLDAAQRGRGSGLWYSAVSLGQFASPLVVVAVTVLVGGLQPVVVVLAAAAAVMSAACFLGLRGSGERLDTGSTH